MTIVERIRATGWSTDWNAYCLLMIIPPSEYREYINYLLGSNDRVMRETAAADFKWFCENEAARIEDIDLLQSIITEMFPRQLTKQAKILEVRRLLANARDPDTIAAKHLIDEVANDPD